MIACNQVTDNPIKQTMELLPDDISLFMHVDFEKLRTDPDLGDLYMEVSGRQKTACAQFGNTLSINIAVA